MQQLYAAMKAEAIATGEKLIESETALDREFAAGKMTPARLMLLTSQIGEQQGALRGAPWGGAAGEGAAPFFSSGWGRGDGLSCLGGS